ncbi:glycosyltransferase family A protein [Gaetbulibacter sp. M235]|uniref:glycosyltransferase family 2 protein n=1 Tax=Gaetbulibacter sp. M235 TaxID=3126510 RepID=UPI00374E76E3
MPFSFLKYLQPTHYFQLRTKAGSFVFPNVDLLPDSIINELIRDAGYESILAQTYDMSWQAIQRGYIGKTPTYSVFEKVSIQDNYRFIRKNFNKAWVFYVFVFRLLSFQNPIKDIVGFFKTRNVKRIIYTEKPIDYSTYNDFKSNLLKSAPLVSVVIPTLNRYTYLKDVLRDLELQTYKNFEVIVVDQTDDFRADFYKEWKLDLRYWFQEEKALWKARNEAIKVAKGNYILLYDDDSLIDPDWIVAHLKTLDYFNADISSGISLSVVGAEIPEKYSLFRVSDQIDTGNVLIKKEVFKAIGLFDRQFEKERMGDGEFGLRAFLNGFLNISNPYAKRLHLKVSTGGLRQMGSWDAFRPTKLFAPRPIPSVLYFFRTYFGNVQSRYELLKSIPLSILPYRFKRNRFMLVFGGIISFIILPIVFVQVYRSWQLASKKIGEGPLIKILE